MLAKKCPVLSEWSTKFYHKISDIMQENRRDMSEALNQCFTKYRIALLIAIMSNQPDKIESLLKERKDKLKEIQKNYMNQLEPRVEQLFNSHIQEWENALDPSGSGVIDFLREITQTKLKGI